MGCKLLLNGEWEIDYLSLNPYTSESEPDFSNTTQGQTISSVTKCPVPGYWEDMLDKFRTTALHTKLKWNPQYTLQRYPQAGYVPDMTLPNPVGCFIYKKNFSADQSEINNPAQLYIGGAQNTVSAWINGKYLGRHEGYSAEFFFDIPSNTLHEGENKITLSVSNTRLLGYMGRPVSGLTTRAGNECTGGIYGDVEIRIYKDGIRDMWVSTAKDLSSFTVHTSGACDICRTLEIFDGKKIVYSTEIPLGESSVTIPCSGYKLWSPTEPNRYTAVLSTKNQTLTCKFGIRRLTVNGTKLYLNGEAYFFRGTCEHCYQPLTVHPTRDKKYYRKVIRTLKELGFNSIRFHTWVPMLEYMEAADELGMIIEVETPNNTSYAEWIEIVKTCRHYTSPTIYSSGNEMDIDEEYIEHLRACAELVHTESDSLFSPMSAMRGIEYYSFGDCFVEEPMKHNPKRLSMLSEFCDIYNSYSLGLTSYDSVSGEYKTLDKRNSIYKKPLLTHEICIQGTYCDLSLNDRYRGSRIGDTELLSSVERHLADKGLLDKANLYYKNSAAWQRVIRKQCFETVRRCETFAGYDFLGDIDTHWHTFGYCVGMMNEFYELKPGETVNNVLRYNSDTVLLADLPSCVNYEVGEKAEIPILVSNYGKRIDNAKLLIRVNSQKQVLLRREIKISNIPSGEVTGLYNLSFYMPKLEKPAKLKLSVSLFGGNNDCENEWEIFVFPKAEKIPSAKLLRANNLSVVDDIDENTLISELSSGKNVVLFGAGPLSTLDATFQLSIAGRTNGHLATVISDHPLMQDFPHDGFCSWQFKEMLNDSKAAILDLPHMPHSPIIDIASTYKNAHREALLFEYSIGNGKLIVCTLNLTDTDPGARWLRSHIISYAMSDEFSPENRISYTELSSLCSNTSVISGKNTNEAQNINDVTMKT